MAKLLDMIDSYLQENGLKYETNDFDDGIKKINMIFKLEQFDINVTILVDEDDDRYLFSCSPSWRVPENKRQQVLTLINDENYRRWSSRIAIDPEDGELVFLNTVNCPGLRPTKKNFQFNFELIMTICEDTTQRIMKETLFDKPEKPYGTNDGGLLSWTPRTDN